MGGEPIENGSVLAPYRGLGEQRTLSHDRGAPRYAVPIELVANVPELLRRHNTPPSRQYAPLTILALAVQTPSFERTRTAALPRNQPFLLDAVLMQVFNVLSLNGVHHEFISKLHAPSARFNRHRRYLRARGCSMRRRK
jgi:hypothetical protein